jgi:hypothetical protein
MHRFSLYRLFKENVIVRQSEAFTQEASLFHKQHNMCRFDLRTFYTKYMITIFQVEIDPGLRNKEIKFLK